MKKLSSSFLVAQTAIALCAVMKHSADIDCSVNSVSRDDEGKVNLLGIVSYNLRLKGLEALGVTKASFRFGVEIKDCEYHEYHGVFFQKGEDHSIRASACANNFIFYDGNGQAVKKFGEDGIFSKAFYDANDTDGFSECDIATSIVDTAVHSLSDAERSVFLSEFLEAFNQSRGIGLGYDY